MKLEKTADGRWSCNLEDIKKLKVRNTELLIGETIELSYTSEVDKKFEGIEMPVITVNYGRKIRLDELLKFISSDSPNIKFFKDNTDDECVIINTARTLWNVLMDNGGMLPTKLKILERVVVGESSQDMFYNSDTASAYREGYKLLGIDTNETILPRLVFKQGGAVDDKNSWTKEERLVVEIIE